MKRVLLILILGYSTSSWACLTLPRTVALQNSPFFFDYFKISGYSFTIPFSGGNQEVRFTCDANEAGISQLFIDATDDQSTAEADSMPRTALDSVVTEDGVEKFNVITDTAEVPQRTEMSAIQNEQGYSSIDITSTDSQNKLRVTCRNNNGIQQFEAAFLDNTGQPVFTVAAAHNGATRGLNVGPQSAPDATVDMNNLSSGEAQFAGCGGATLPIGRTGENNQRVQN